MDERLLQLLGYRNDPEASRLSVGSIASFVVASKLGVIRLPGDIVWRKANFTFYAPLGLMLLVAFLLIIGLLFSRR